MRLAPALVLVVAAASPCAMADLVTNGGFEHTVSYLSGWSTFGSASSFVQLSPALIGADSGVYGTAMLQVASIGGFVGIRQTLSQAQIGDRVSISFHLFNRGASGMPDNDFYGSLGGVSFLSLADEPFFGPRVYTTTVVVGSDSPVLEFGFRHQSANWVIDNISAVNLVPLPAGAWIGLAGLAGVGAVARRRKR